MSRDAFRAENENIRRRRISLFGRTDRPNDTKWSEAEKREGRGVGGGYDVKIHKMDKERSRHESIRDGCET